MPSRGPTLARPLMPAAVVVAALAAGLLLFESGDSYTVSLTLDSASQLVEGNAVKVGGVRVGKVTNIGLAPDRRARVEIELHDDELSPLHRGTTATVQFDALTSVAARYVALTPGPMNEPTVPDGGELDADDVRAAVDFDQFLSSIDARTQATLRGLLRRAPKVLRGDGGRLANAGIEALSPAFSQGGAIARELTRDRRALGRLLDGSGQVASALASRPADLEQLTGHALDAMTAVAERSDSLDSSLGRLAPTLRRANTTLLNLRATIEDLRPLVREARPSAGPLADVLARLQPIARRARPVVATLRRTVRRPGRANDLVDALRGLPAVERAAVPAFSSTDRLLGDLAPIVTEARPYTPDLVGVFRGFGGTMGGYYDANGRYARVAIEEGLASLTGSGSLVPLPQLGGLPGLRTGLVRRCPGAATQKLPDGSNPYYEVAGTCDPEHGPK